MPFIELKRDTETWARKAKRVLISGPPNSGKTTSMRTFLLTPESRIACIVYPGEAGSSSIPIDERIKTWVWEDIDVSKGVDWAKILGEVKTLTFDILAGKHGKFDVFWGDGLHKLYGLFLAGQTAGASENGEDFDAKEYGKTHKAFFQHLNRIKQSTIDTAAFTVWDGREKDDPDAKDKDTSKHIFPELPGAAAKMIMGEFSVALYASVQGVGAGAQYKWQTKPQGKVWGCGLKAPVEITSKIPTQIEQNWGALLPLLLNQPVKKEEMKK